MESLKVSRILHAGYIFETDYIKIAFDPIFENPFSHNCHAFPNVKFEIEKIKSLKFDAVFVSHYHDDHFSLDSLNLLSRDTPIYFYCVFEELFELLKQMGFKNVNPLTIDHPVEIGPIQVIPRRALDQDVDSIFQIKVHGLNILNVVDSWIDTDTMDLLTHEGNWDLVLWPFQTMQEIEVLSPSRHKNIPRTLPPEWIHQLKILNPRFVVPSSCQFILESWSWYNQRFFPISYKQFQNEIAEALPNCKIVRMDPSASFELSSKSIAKKEPLDWITPIGPQDVDYEFIEDLKIPPTSEISKKFPPLDKKQIESIEHFCSGMINQRFRNLDSDDSLYFQKPKIWELNVFDHTGGEQKYFYSINRSEMTLLAQNPLKVHWTTEISAFKLYSALYFGEALTSLYIRINDRQFDAEVEKSLDEVDVLEDPLVRCLYTGAIGSYQKIQLARLKSR